jgi:hypothetical protein
METDLTYRARNLPTVNLHIRVLLVFFMCFGNCFICYEIKPVFGICLLSDPVVYSSGILIRGGEH